MICYHEKFGFGLVKEIEKDVVTITFDGISEKSIIKSKVTIIDDNIVDFIENKKYENMQYKNEDISDFKFSKVSYNGVQKQFTLYDNYQNRIDIEFNNNKATTICSCLNTFDCIHGYAALEYLHELFMKINEFSSNIDYYLSQIVHDGYTVDYDHIKAFVDNSQQTSMTKIIEGLDKIKYDNQVEIITAAFMSDKERREAYVEAVNALNDKNYYKRSAIPYIRRYYKIARLDNSNPRESDRESSVILYYFFNSQYSKIIDYINDRYLNYNSTELIANLMPSIINKIANDEKINILKSKELDDFCFNNLVRSLDDENKRIILANVDNKHDLSSDLLEYAPISYLEYKLNEGNDTVFDYVTDNPKCGVSEQARVAAAINNLFESYYDSRKIAKIGKYKNTKELLKALSKIHSFYYAKKVDDDAIILDTTGIELSTKNYLDINEVDLFSYMKPFIGIYDKSKYRYEDNSWQKDDDEEERLCFGIAILGKFIALQVFFSPADKSLDFVEKYNFLGEQKYIDYVYTFIKQHFSDKLNDLIESLEERRRQKKIQKILKQFDSVTSDFKKNISSYTTRAQAKARLEVSLDADEISNEISFKIGTEKLYTVSNISDFLTAFKYNERKNYGKYFSFVHNTDNLIEPYKSIIKLLLQFPNISAKKKLLDITDDCTSHIIELLKGEHIYFNGKLILLDLTPKKVNAQINDDMVFDINLTENQKIVILADEVYIVDYDAAIMYKALDDKRYKQFIKLASKIDGMPLEPVIERFNDEIYPYINNYLDISPIIQNRFKVSDLEIIAYFDYNNKILSVKESFKHDGVEIKKNDFKTQDQRKYDEYKAYLESLGFLDGICQSEEQIFDFMAMDFSHLRELASVYLSDSIQNHQVVNFQKPVIKINYNSGIMECFMEDSEYDEEELFKLYQGMKLKKKYVLLKNNRIVQIEDDEMAEVMDDLHIDKKHPYESVALPIYQALCAYAHKDMIQIDDYLKNMLDELTNFKSSKLELPSVNAKLRPYQIEGFNWLSILAKYHMGGILADDMGLGKTLQVITLIAACKEQKPCLIVCPKSLIFNWKNEFEKFAPDICVKQIYGGASARQELISKMDTNNKEVYITAYDSLRNDIDAYKDKIFKYIILDEAQYIKNVQAEKSLAVKKLKGDAKFALTGTPIENNVIDLWSIFEFVMPGYFEELSVFKVKYNSNDNYPAHIAKKIAPFVLRRTKNNVLKDLPAKFETIIQAPMTQAQRKLYDAHLMMARNALQNGARAFDILPFILRLRQICVDPRTFQDGSEEGGKLQMLSELIVKYIDEGHKILIFSQFVKCLNLIEDILNKLHLKYFMITGDTKPEKRIEYANRFNASDEIKVFLVSLKAGGTGLNLVGADVVIHMDPWWNQAVESQATDRAYRIGQKRNVEVVKLICENTIEERVIELQNMKRDIIDKIISNDDTSVTSASLEDIHFVLK